MRISVTGSAGALIRTLQSSENEAIGLDVKSSPFRGSIVLGQMTESEITALLDAHDTLVRECVESRFAFEEFLASYGDFPAALDEDARSADGGGVLRLFARRIAFHRRVAGVISGLRVEADSPGMETEVGRFMPMVGLMRLRELVTRYPDFRAHEGPAVRLVGIDDSGASSSSVS